METAQRHQQTHPRCLGTLLSARDSRTSKDTPVPSQGLRPPPTPVPTLPPVPSGLHSHPLHRLLSGSTVGEPPSPHEGAQSPPRLPPLTATLKTAPNTNWGQQHFWAPQPRKQTPLPLRSPGHQTSLGQCPAHASPQDHITLGPERVPDRLFPQGPGWRPSRYPTVSPPGPPGLLAVSVAAGSLADSINPSIRESPRKVPNVPTAGGVCCQGR